MNENYDYSTHTQGQSNEPDYYAMYIQEKTNEARGVFSRYHLALFLFTVIAYVVIIAAEVFILLFVGKDKAAYILDNIYVQWIFGVGPMYLIAFPVFVFLIKGMKTSKREKTKMSAREFLSLLLAGEGLMLVGNIIGQILNSFIGTIIGHEITNSTSELIDSSPIWLIFLVTVILAPIIEELMFRKFMIDRFSRYGDLLAVIISAVAFGLFHGNFYQFFYATMLGFILGYIYTRTRNVKYTILMHMIINFLGSVAVIPILDIMNSLVEMMRILEAGGQVNFSAFIQYAFIIASYSVIQFVLYIAGIITLIVYIKHRLFKFENKYDYKLPRERTAGVVFLNVGTILFLTASLVLFGISIFLE